MLLVIDVGNTDTTLGVFDAEKLVHHARVVSEPRRTTDEYAVIIRSLLQLGGIEIGQIHDAAIASVVPGLTQQLVDACERQTGHRPLVVGPGIKTGISIRIDDPREVGADRIVNAVAAWNRFAAAAIIVDFGTATNLDFINDAGEYQGGIISSGIYTAHEALFAKAARLPRVEIARPPSVIGKNTVHAMQSGLYYGYAGLVDGLVKRIRAETGTEARVIATGGLARLIAPASETIDEVDEDLTLGGLRLLFERNRG